MIIKHYFPEAFQKYFPLYIWQSRVSKILVTFDDGPSINTRAILKKLQQNNIKTFFFCTGKNAVKYPELVKEIAGEGHLIGAHGLTHRNGWRISGRQYEDEIIKASDILADITGEPVKYYRPPYGKLRYFRDKKLKKLDFTPVIWSLLTMDYQNNEDIVKFVIQKYLGSGSVVVLHDRPGDIGVTMTALETLLKVAKINGFEFGVPEECLKLSS